jgi:hypothetical protein
MTQGLDGRTTAHDDNGTAEDSPFQLDDGRAATSHMEAGLNVETDLPHPATVAGI